MMIKPTPNIKMLYWGSTSHSISSSNNWSTFKLTYDLDKSLPPRKVFQIVHIRYAQLCRFMGQEFFCSAYGLKKKISEVLPKPEPGQLLLRCQISVASLIAEVGNIRWRWPCRRDGYYQGTSRLPCVSEQWSKFVLPDNQVPCTIRVPRTRFKPDIQHEYFSNSLER